MKIYLKEKFLSLLDHYDLFDEKGNVFLTVQGQFAFGHDLKVYDPAGREIASLKENFSFPLSFEATLKGVEAGTIKEEYSFRMTFSWPEKGISIRGDFSGFHFLVSDSSGREIASLDQKVFAWTKTFALDVKEEGQSLPCVLLLLAVCAAKCERDNP